jgi:hypothetical protein
MNRRVVKQGCDVEAVLETRSGKSRVFTPGNVLNILQWLRPETARFTVEGEGIDVWCCPREVIDERSEAPQPGGLNNATAQGSG